MTEDNFRPRVPPSRAQAPLESWPDQADRPRADPQPDAQSAEDGAEDLLGPFDAIRRALDARRAADLEEEQGGAGGAEPAAGRADTPPTPTPAADPEPVAPKADEPKTIAPPATASKTATPKTAAPKATAPKATAPKATAPTTAAAAPTQPKAAEPKAATPGRTEPIPTSAMPAAHPDIIDDAGSPPDGARRRGRGRIVIAVAVAVALAFCAGIAVDLTGGHGGNAENSGSPPAAGSGVGADNGTATASAVPTPDTLRAVAWVNTDVGPTHIVACDPIVCSLLRADGFPASAVQVVSSVTDVEQADVVVLSGVLRGQLGSETATIVAPEPLVVFGTGSGRVEIATVQLQGPAGYAQSMGIDREGRRAAGTALLADPRLTVDAPAQALLAAGLVDSRVCALLALLTGSHTVVVAGFTPIGPGAGPDIPSAGVVVESVDGQPATGSSAAAAALLTTVQAQQAPYRPMSAAPGELAGLQGLQIVYTQPGPLGLLPSSTS